VIEELEIRCWEKVQTIVKTEEGLGIEYDENVICDVCRSVSTFALLCIIINLRHNIVVQYSVWFLYLIHRLRIH